MLSLKKRRKTLLDNEIHTVNIPAFEYSRSVYPDIAAFCRPFLTSCNLTTFVYGKLFYDKKYLLFSNNVSFLERFLLFVSDIEGSMLHNAIQNTPLGRPIHTLWSSAPEDRLIQMLRYLDLWNGLDIYYRSDNFIEVWSFSTSQAYSIEIDNFYLNNLKLLHRFCLCFREKFSHLLTRNDETRLATFKEGLDISFQYSLDWIADVNTLFSFLSLAGLNLPTKSGNVRLTKREVDCLFHMAQGKISKEIAQALNISTRTVEFYIASIKKKTGLYNKSRLIELFNGTLLEWL
jgi:DNA-binding CsgD family transcriptional regulator